MAIRIPTGKVPKNTARWVSIALGLLVFAVDKFAPQFKPVVEEVLPYVGEGLVLLGVTLGKAEAP